MAAHPDDTDLRGALAYALASTGQFTAAIEQYRFMLDREPMPSVLTNLAMLLVRTGNADEARQRLERASALAPEHANTAFALAELLARQRRRDEAFRQFRQAARLSGRRSGRVPASSTATGAASSS